MIFLKSHDEIELMRIAGRIVALTHEELKHHIKPGISTKQLDKIAEDFIIKQGATPSFKGLYGFPAATCISVNEVLIHGIPNDTTILKDGDIVSIDIGACYKGYHGDSAWSYAVGNISNEARRLLEVTEAALYKGLEMAKAGNRVGDISNAIQEYAEGYGYGVPQDFTGHGVGRKLHEEPMVPNFGQKGRGPLLRSGMTIAVEPMIQQGTYRTRTLSDGWTTVSADGKLTAHYEHTIVILDNGYEILTKL
jgi:methionyl aminopeptidase